MKMMGKKIIDLIDGKEETVKNAVITIKLPPVSGKAFKVLSP